MFFTKEVMERVKRDWLRPGGTLVMNFVGYHNGAHAVVPKSIYRTFQSVFLHVRAFREVPDADAPEACNLVFFGAEHELSFTLPSHGYYKNPDEGTFFAVSRSKSAAFGGNKTLALSSVNGMS